MTDRLTRGSARADLADRAAVAGRRHPRRDRGVHPVARRVRRFLRTTAGQRRPGQDPDLGGPGAPGHRARGVARLVQRRPLPGALDQRGPGQHVRLARPRPARRSTGGRPTRSCAARPARSPWRTGRSRGASPTSPPRRPRHTATMPRGPSSASSSGRWARTACGSCSRTPRRTRSRTPAATRRRRSPCRPAASTGASSWTCSSRSAAPGTRTTCSTSGSCPGRTAALMAQHAAATAAYARLLAAGQGWLPGYGVRLPLAEWDFGLATSRLAQAQAVLDLRGQLRTQAAALGLGLPARPPGELRSGDRRPDGDPMTWRPMSSPPSRPCRRGARGGGQPSTTRS